jgi:hypothetical protein
LFSYRALRAWRPDGSSPRVRPDASFSVTHCGCFRVQTKPGWFIRICELRGTSVLNGPWQPPDSNHNHPLIAIAALPQRRWI